MNETKNNSKVKILIGVLIVVVLAVIFALVYNNFGPKSSSKNDNTNGTAIEQNSEDTENTEVASADESEVDDSQVATETWTETTPEGSDDANDETTKNITIEVIDDQEQSVLYEVETDAEFLRQAMEESDMEFSGEESDYGMYVQTINGVTADYNTDGAYWAFYVDGDYCNYGIDSQPLEDGQAYQIIYTTGM
jgi:flagellar basal body-associated protein FliL